MAFDLTVILPDRPGTNAEMGEALGGAGINMLGACGVGVAGKGYIHILVEDPDAASAALRAAGLDTGESRAALQVKIEDRPGAFGELSRRIANAGVNVEQYYLATDGSIVLVPDDIDSARAAL